MKIKLLLIMMLITLSLIACSTKKIPEVKEDVDTNDTIEDINYGIITDTEEFLDREQLKERLLTARAIELKNTENQTIGILQEKEEIVNLLEKIYTYEIQEELLEEQQGQVIGPINFYFSDNEDIFGLMNNKYIYIEGYYFIINRNKSQEMKNLFKANIATAPTGTE